MKLLFVLALLCIVLFLFLAATGYGVVQIPWTNYTPHSTQAISKRVDLKYFLLAAGLLLLIVGALRKTLAV